MLESLRLLDNLRLNFSPEGLTLLNIALSIVMFGVALEIKPAHFRSLIEQPKSILTGVFSQFLVLPALTFLLTLLLKDFITPSIALGMLLVASCPGGNISNFITNMAKGNVALSVGLTGIATVGAIFFTPINFSFWGQLYISFIESNQAEVLVRPLEIDPFEVFETVFLILGLPLLTGLVVAYKFPNITEKLVGPIKKLSVVIFAAIVVIALKNNFSYFMQYVHYLFIIVLLHNGLALISGFSVSTIFRLPSADRRTVTIETGIQNSGLGLVLLFNPEIFPVDLPTGGMACITAWWGIWHIISGLTIAWTWANHKRLTSKLATIVS
ncbi:bile acid:sodium symporter family protein [Limibacter armeniacum]|uniref:bile acid:sodium symporter family protein n=1 Tax=Limibacter armeniacum TaxID=466084 RepID=UPI002FE66BE4